ncbi:MAG: Mpo1-like protein, partial [Ginsengibacter sp.]
LCFLIENYLPVSLWLFSLIVFVAAWIGQFYGHKIEGKKPSFFKDLQFLLIGPMWLMSFVYKKMGMKY